MSNLDASQLSPGQAGTNTPKFVIPAKAGIQNRVATGFQSCQNDAEERDQP